MPAAYDRLGGSTTPCSASTARKNSSGIWVRIPAPSPESGSAPEAPRCSRFSSAVMACWMTMWDFSPDS